MLDRRTWSVNSKLIYQKVNWEFKLTDMATKRELVRINDAAQALLQSKIDPLAIADPLSPTATPTSSHSTPKPPPVSLKMLEKCLMAVRTGDLEQIRFLSTHVHGFTQLTDNEGMPLLHVATSVDNLEVMALLVALGCNLNGLDARGGTAVLEAACVGNMRGLEWLVEAGIDGKRLVFVFL